MKKFLIVLSMLVVLGASVGFANTEDVKIPPLDGSCTDRPTGSNGYDGNDGKGPSD